MSSADRRRLDPAPRPAGPGPALLSRRGLLLGAAASGLLAACGTTSASSGTTSPSTGSTSASASAGSTTTSAGAPVKGGTLLLGSPVPDTAVDPVLTADGTSLAAIQLVAEYLFWIEANGSLRPVLGLSSSVDDSGLVWTVKLRKGVIFNDGTPFTADAVVSSFTRLIAPNSESSAANTFSGILHSVSKVDDSTVAFKLFQPFSDFPYLLSSANYNTFILPTSYTGNWTKNPAGTGAFTLTEYVVGEKFTFKRRPSYWNADKIYLDAVNLLLYKDDQSLTLALESGEIDAEVYSVASDATSLNKSQINVESVVSASFVDLALRVDKPPFNDRSVRQAVAWALDRTAINSVQAEGIGTPANDHVFAPVYKIHPQGLVQREKNVDMVHSLLGGRTISFTITGSQSYVTYATQLQQQLNAAGFKVELSTLSDTAYYGGSNSTTPWLNAEASLTDWVSRPSPAEFLSYMYKTKADWNASHYSNPTLDKLIASYDRASSVADKQSLTNQIAKITWDDVPVVIPVWEPSVRFVSKKVHGLGPDPGEFLDPTGVWVDA